MTSRSRRRFQTLAMGLLLGSLPAWAQDARYRDGRFLEIVGAVTIQRADEASSDEAVRNMPFLPGDRVWTDDSGRAEIVFADGEILWIAERSRVDSLGRGGRDQDERLGLRVFAGSFGGRVRMGGQGFEFRAPGGSITTTGAASFRLDVRAGETTLTVTDGEVLTNLGGSRVTLRGGERLRYADGRVDGPFRNQPATVDSFDRWCDERSAELSRAARRDDRLPSELDGYGDELERNGDWVYDEPEGYVYVPRVSAGWAPYTYGRWVYTLYGWTWVADEPWGFVTSHYGRWGYSSRVGWRWLPRAGFSGAWVGWATPIGPWSHTIGWCALGFNDRPVGSFAYSQDRRRGDLSVGDRGWSFLNRTDMGRGSVDRRRVDLPAEEASRAVVWNGGTTPDRDFKASQRSAEAGRGRSGDDRGAARGLGSDERARVYLRATPGDSTPELRSDPTTTIPTPESRRQRTIGQDGFKNEQNDRRNRARHDDFSLSSQNGGSSDDSTAARQSQPDGVTQNPRPADSARAKDDLVPTQRNPERPSRDPLLSRFFRSINRADSRDREASRPPADEATANPPRPRAGDDASAREDSPRPRSRPQPEENRGGSRPSGAGRPETRPSPQPQASPDGGGGSDEREARRRPRDK